MADFLVSNSMLMLEKAMNFQWTKQSVILDNITNADTPDYKTQYVTFEEAFNRSLRTARLGPKPTASMRSVISTSSPVVHIADDETFRMDGNGVNVAEQQLEAVRNSYQLNYVFKAMSSDMSRLLLAIRGQ
ncbi:MAG: flagellar basal body rod protein FlgB [Oscillospiraceae bacterium]|nr:flagellar basal body rod protein FlgB [Oscillospiraceae bacterium]